MDVSEYQDKRVIVTGCSSGIGEATARALSRHGAEVHGLDRDQPDVDASLASFERFDLGDPASIESAVARIGGRVDALFNCAGVAPMAPPLDVLRVNFLGTRLLTYRVLDLMSAGSAIVSTSSDGGFRWRLHLPLLVEFLGIDTFEGGLAWFRAHEEAAGHPYAFGKEALNVWTMLQSAILIKRGIRINTTSPGAVQTPMLEAIEAAVPVRLIEATEQPIGRRSSAAEQVGPLLFLNSDRASYINGADLAVDGGYRATLSVAGKL